jgi:phage baseplate assembly protein W
LRVLRAEHFSLPAQYRFFLDGVHQDLYSIPGSGAEYIADRGLMTASTYRDPISWPFLPMPQANGQLGFNTLEQSVRDSIRIILTTRPGEQLMQPLFGAGLQNFLNEGNTVAMRRQIQAAIVNSLQTYEARIAVDNVEVETVAGAPSQIHVQIFYRLLRTNAPQQIGITMQGG